MLVLLKAYMTTIAASVKHRCMAADSKVVVGGTLYYANKIKRLPNGSLMGAAGPYEQCSIMERFIVDGVKPEFGDSELEFQVLILERDGLVLYTGGIEPVRLLDKVAAIGSGGDAALALLRYGLNPEEAVKGAILVDNGSGGAVHVEPFKVKR